MKAGYFVPTPGIPKSQIVLENGEYIPKIHQPERVLRIFLHRILTTGDISEGFVDMIEEAYEEQRKVNRYNSNTIQIASIALPLDEIAYETSGLGRDSKFSIEEKNQFRDSIEQKMRETLGKIGAESSITTRKSPHHPEIEELRIDANLIRKLQIAAGKQKILEVLSGKVVYTYTPEEVINIVRENLGKLGVTEAYLESFIQKKSSQTSASL